MIHLRIVLTFAVAVLPGAWGLAYLGQSTAPAGAGSAAFGLQKPPANPVAVSLVGFKERLDGYIKLRNEITQKVPEVKETGDPAKISSREAALGKAIAAARASAKPGDIFGDATPHLTRFILEDWKSRSAADRKALLNEVPRHVKVAINVPYPATLPLVSVPANLLARLPQPPEELEYRFIDRHFFLRDRDANLVVDIIFNVLPR